MDTTRDSAASVGGSARVRLRTRSIAALAALGALGLAAVVTLSPGGAQAAPSVGRGVPPEQAQRVIDQLLARGVIQDPSEVLEVTPDSVALQGDPTEPSISVTSAAGKTAPNAGKTSKGGGKGGSSGGGGTVVIGGGSTGGSSSSYVLQNGVGLLTSYQLTTTSGTPTYMVDGLTAAGADAATYTGSVMVKGTASTGAEPLNGEIRLSASDSVICGGSSAAGCTWSWYDGTRVLKAQIQMATWAPSTAARCLIGHELGHGLGLAHVNDTTQLMNPMWTQGSSPCSYQNGDAAGLKLMGSVKSTL